MRLRESLGGALLLLCVGTCTTEPAIEVAGGGGTASAGAPGKLPRAAAGAPGAGSGSGGASGSGSGGLSTPRATGPRWAPPGHETLALHELSAHLLAYVPHQVGGAQLRGSGHTHCAPDHSKVPARTQQARLRDLPGAHAHDFVWMTAHSFVAPDPDVDGITHLFGIEVYAATLPDSGVAPHVLGYLPDGALADATELPFGAFSQDVAGTARRIRAAGGVPALAHPSRLPMTSAELAAVGDELWGVEVMSGGTELEYNLELVDQRLDAGRYVCLTAGGDVHAEDYRLTMGYQVVSTPSATPSARELFEAVRACNFFACSTQNTDIAPIPTPRVVTQGDTLVVSAGGQLESLRWVGAGGRVVAEGSNVSQLSYRPSASDVHVRAELWDAHRQARCFSQPIRLVRPDAL